MFKNFLLSSFRNFRKNRSFTFLNLLGLAVAICGIYTIYVFIQSELSVDHQLTEKESTYLVTFIEETDASSREVGLVDIQTDNWLRNKNSEVTSGHHIRNIGKTLMRNQHIKGERTLTLAESNFFEYFNIPMIHGDLETALTNPNSIVLSEEAANQFFGDSNPVGLSLEVYGDFNMPLQVTGVIKNDGKLHINYDCIVSWDSKPADSPNSIGDWYSRSTNCYIKTTSAENANLLASKLT